MTDPNVNTVSEPLTIDKAVQRLQEKRTAAAQATATSSTVKPIKEAPKSTPAKVEVHLEEDEEGEVTEPEGEAITEEVIDDGTQTASDEGEGSAEEQEVFVVKIKNAAGEEVEQEVPAEELVKGYLRQADYTRKRAEDIKEHKAKLTEVNQKVGALDEAIKGALIQQTQELQSFQSIDWAQLQKTDINEYNRLQLAYVNAQRTVNQRQAQLQAIKEYQHEQMVAQSTAYLKEQESIVKDVIPNWDTRKSELAQYLTDIGIEDFSPFVHHQMALLVHKAKQFDDLQSKKETVVKKKLERSVPNSLRPGTTMSNAEVNNETVAALEARLRKSGSLEDALALKKAKRGMK